jgi:hypothetical protein
VSSERHSRWGVLVLLVPLAMLAWVAFGNVREDEQALAGPFRQLHGVRSDAEREAVSDLLTDAYEVLRSPQFQANLRSLEGRYPAIYQDNAHQSATIADTADLLALERPGARYVPVDVILEDSLGAFAGMAGENAAGQGRYADIVLSRYVLAAYGHRDAVVRSCAVNVAAHEMAHTLSRTRFLYRPAFTDTSRATQAQIPGRRDRTTPVASYLIGSVAQCTWLQKQGRIASGEVAACVEVFGVAAGNDQRCGQFADGQPVVPRPDLRPATPPL